MFAVVYEDDSYWHNDALLRMQKKRTTQCNYDVTITIAENISLKLLLEITREILWYISHFDLSWIGWLKKTAVQQRIKKWNIRYSNILKYNTRQRTN